MKTLKAVILRALRFIFFGVPKVDVRVSVAKLSGNEALKGKCVLIAGGTRGLGFAFAQRFLEAGAFVIITGRNKETLDAAAARLGSGCKGLVFDSASVKDLDSFFRAAQGLAPDKYIDALVYNSGISLHESSFESVSEENFDAQFDVNIKGAYFFAKSYACALDGKRGGNILFVSSERGLYCDDIPYGLTKAALNSFTRGLARRLVRKNIRVNAIAPGVTASDMTGYDKNENLFRDSSAGGRVFLPEEVAEVALFLLSDASNCISGEIIACNQGNALRANC